MKNRHGLSRDIPEPVKRSVRQACGFGCVICGSSIVEYEHVEPEFPDAQAHDPAGIALICPQCHSKVTTGLWSKAKVKTAMLAPRCKQTGFANEAFDIGVGHPSIAFGGLTLKNCEIPVQVRDLPLFQIKGPEEPGAPFRLTAHFFNASGQPSLLIRDNEWFALSSNWDVEVSGGAITIRDAPGHISLRLVAEPPHDLVIERLDMRVYGLHFTGNADELAVAFPGGGVSVFTSCLADNCRVGLMLG